MPVNHPAAEFIRLLTGSADALCTFFIGGDHDGYAETPRAMRGRFQDVLAVLERENKRGAGIFLTMNETLGRRRRKTDVTGVRVLFVDGDKVERPDFWPISPTIVQTREAKWHAFWRLTSGEDIARWESAMRALAVVYGGDTAVCELARVMRLPGFLHHKDPDFPTSYALAETNDVLYVIDHVLVAHGIDPAAITAQASVVASGPPVDGHVITDQEWTALEDKLELVIPKSRHNSLLAWTCDAYAAGMPDADIIDLMHAWILEHGRSPQPREVENAISFAREKSKAGTLKIHTPGVRSDLDFTVATAEALPAIPTAPTLDPPAAQAQVAALVDWTKEILLNKDATWKSHVRNVELILTHDPRLANLFRYNLFTSTVEVQPTAGNRLPWRRWANGGVEWTDDDGVAFAQWCARAFDARPALDAAVIHAAVRPFSRVHAYHPVREYLSGLTWDKVPRLDLWLTSYLGVTDTAYARAIGRRFLIGAVARVQQPGCKLDTMLTMEGPQGIGKSSAVRVLFNGWYTDAALDVSNKDAASIIRGHWGVEFGEMHTARRAEVTELKAFMSRREDRQRDAYGRVPETHPRQCVFVGTTNSAEYLNDETGGRRFWPAICGRIHLDRLLADRGQLWAEALAAFDAGEAWWLTAEEEVPAKVEQAARRMRDEIEDAISAWLSKPDNFVVSGIPVNQGVTGLEVWVGALGATLATFTRQNQGRVSGCMRALGFKRQAIRRGDVVVKGYVLDASRSQELQIE